MPGTVHIKPVLDKFRTGCSPNKRGWSVNLLGDKLFVVSEGTWAFCWSKLEVAAVRCKYFAFQKNMFITLHKMLYYMSWTQIIQSKIKLQNTALQPDLSSRSTLVMCVACSQDVNNLNKTRLLSGSQNTTILMDRSASGVCSDFWHPESKQNT